MKDVKRWEVGSAYPLVLPRGQGGEFPTNASLYGSGRQALRALVAHGKAEFGWEAVHLPTYFCPDVATDLAETITVHRYENGPVGPRVGPAAGPHDAVIAMSYFGAMPFVPRTRAHTIVDVSHDLTAPWIERLEADYIVASLRKTLPVPDGGAVWSTTGRKLPPAVMETPGHLATVGTILSAMCLKSAYLGGAISEKDRYLSLFTKGEVELRCAPVSGISEYSRQALRVLPMQRLREHRLKNAARLGAKLAQLPGAATTVNPFGVVVEFESGQRRDLVRQQLIEEAVYPAVLWDLPAGVVRQRQRSFSQRMLFMHTDFRWSYSDMDRVAEILRTASRRHVPGQSQARENS